MWQNGTGSRIVAPDRHRKWFDIFAEKIPKMSAMDCEIVGTGDGKLNSRTKSAGSASKTIAKDIVLEIVDNALDLSDDKAMNQNKNIIMEQISVEQFKERFAAELTANKQKSGNPLIGTGDQKSNDALKTEEPITCHPPVEKKNRLTDLVKNSKQVLAKIMMSDSKLKLQEEKKEDEQVVEVIELDCIHASDLPFKSSSRIVPEEVPLPESDSEEILSRPHSEESMEEIGLKTDKDGSEPTAERRRMTFPRSSGSGAKAAFVARCRTLKREATNLKKKKWDVSGRIASFFRKRRAQAKEDVEAKSSAKHDLEQVVENAKE